MTQIPKWQPVSMIHVFYEMTTGMLDNAETQFENLKQVQDRPHVLDDDTVKRIIKAYTEQNTNTDFMFQQCRQWQLESLNEKQTEWLESIEKNLNKLKIIISDILSLTKNYETKTINKVMVMDDIELLSEVMSKS